MPPEQGQKEAPLATHDGAAPLNSAPATYAFSDAGDAPAPQAALADLEFTITLDDARALFHSLNRKVPAERTLQNYCAEGKIAGDLKPTEDGQRWFLNKASLIAFIESKPLATSADATLATHDFAAPLNSAPATSAFSDAGDAPAPHAEPNREVQHRSTTSDDVYEHPYVKRLEKEVSEYKVELKEQVRRTEQLQSEALNKLVELQRMTTIGQSKTLAEFMLQAKNWIVGGEPPPPSDQ